MPDKLHDYLLEVDNNKRANERAMALAQEVVARAHGNVVRMAYEFGRRWSSSVGYTIGGAGARPTDISLFIEYTGRLGVFYAREELVELAEEFVLSTKSTKERQYLNTIVRELSVDDLTQILYTQDWIERTALLIYFSGGPSSEYSQFLRNQYGPARWGKVIEHVSK